jgi:indole-3-glycerol phosphate synthase
VRERGITVVGESGIFTIDDVNVLQDAGVGCLLVVGLCTLNQVDPWPITYSLSNP